MSSEPVGRMEQGIRITSWLWVLGIVVTVAGIGLLVSGAAEGRMRVRLEQALFFAWALGPPAWFVIQQRLWPATPAADHRFRMHQALIRPIWAGVLAVLAAIIFGRWG